jgi:hypothetical protein
VGAVAAAVFLGLAVMALTERAELPVLAVAKGEPRLLAATLQPPALAAPRAPRAAAQEVPGEAPLSQAVVEAVHYRRRLHTLAAMAVTFRRLLEALGELLVPGRPEPVARLLQPVILAARAAAAVRPTLQGLPELAVLEV